jgi:hypothetical protein
MAKPIPVNRRWQENQRMVAQNGASRPATPPAPRRLFAPDSRRTLREALAELLGALQEEPEVEHLAPVREPPPRVIQARYAQTCTGCGMPIRVGDSITRHPRWGEWVHVGCREREQRAAQRVIEARYDGVCRVCIRPIRQGQLITRCIGYGWVHQECASRGRR